MNQSFAFKEVARLAAKGDNVAIATRTLEPSTIISLGDGVFSLNATVLEGHRFAVTVIAQGEPLLSWGLPFGVALKGIQAGDYVANQSMLETLKARNVSLSLPDSANFEDAIEPYDLNEASFQAVEQLSLYDHELMFDGYVRESNRGVGTRNTIILLGTSSLTASYVKALESRFKEASQLYPNLDGVVAIAHTEAGSETFPNNYDLVLRTLAGFMVHPNVAAVLCVDYGTEVITNKILEAYLRDNKYALDAVPHAFLSLNADLETNLSKGEQIIQAWLEPANSAKRERVSASHLKLALQCGGSDAFSGISGNPLAAWVAQELIRYGGSANLAETDELIGAESYVLQKVKSLKVARQFLATVERFKARAAWHGTSAEGNPSGGNKFRGLYNIVLKSIGAANKKNPDVRLDAVIDYGEPMKERGYYFMDSPGNDLESIAGQVASGCNMIFFVTGNGSVTNFPFVPTIKIVTTTERFKLLENDMDVNAGAYLDGSSMERVGKDTLELFIKVASGQKSVGELAGHSQVQLWRNWQQSNVSQLASLLNQPEPSGQPIALHTSATSNKTYEAFEHGGNLSSEQIGLIVPTSLCSGQIAKMMAEKLNTLGLGKDKGISRFVALTHTEGCGVSGGQTEVLQTRTLLNYLRHPFVRHAFLLEHGCEKTHNDHMRNTLATLNMTPEQFGWASIQLDGGIEKVSQKMEQWFIGKLEHSSAPKKTTTSLASLRLGIVTSGTLPDEVSQGFAELTKLIVGSGGTVVMPESVLAQSDFATQLDAKDDLTASLAFGQYASSAGFHLMQSPTTHWVETLTGLAATGVEVILAYVATHPQQTHPIVPVLQVSSAATASQAYAKDIDAFLSHDERDTEALLELICSTLSQAYKPKLSSQQLDDFQMTRGLLGISM